MSGMFGGDSDDLDWTGDLGEYDGERNEHGERHGEGKAVLPNGDIYEGTYFHGQRHGKLACQLNWSSEGPVPHREMIRIPYKPEFFQGVYIFRNGAKYSGFYDHGLRDGPGIFEYPDGSKYEGKWEKNERNGQGVYNYANGDIYDGEWKNNRKEGKGVYTCAATKLKYDGHWEDGKLQGPASTILPNHVYFGSFVNNMPCGPGRYVFDFGVEQHGEYIFPEIENANGELQVMDYPVWRCHPDLHPLGS